MLANVTLNYDDFFKLAVVQLPFMVNLLAALWAFNLINWLIGGRLNIFGIYPRSAFGLIGIPCSPFPHGNFNHLFFNSIPLFVLGMFILALGRNEFIAISIMIALLEGILVWLFARKSLHIGASGVISGYFGFVLGLAYFHPTAISLVLAFVAVYYFGSIIAGIFPTGDLVSWESHLAGLIAGLVVMYVMLYLPGFEQWVLGLVNMSGLL